MKVDVRHLNRLLKKLRDTTADLKQHLIAAWSGLLQHVIDEAINQWRGQVRACVTADGRHFEFEHLL